jgi:LmbE family N-acetylglucosaminyl deacetylase
MHVGTTLNIVAHEDDDLLFLSPDLLYAIRAGRTVRTVFLCAGDAGADVDYWQGREAGARAAYARMCGVANSWTQTDAGIVGHPIPVFTLSTHPSVSLAFLRLPDGNLDGSGFPSTNHRTLQMLWMGKISTIDAIDGSSSYSKETLTSTLTSLMSSFQPDQINTQDYVGTYGDGDHSDHYTVAYLVQAAMQEYTTPHSFTGYEDYNTCCRPANVTGADLIAKQDAFYAYVQHDAFVWGVPSILTKYWRVSVRFRHKVSLLRSFARYLLKSVAHLLVPKKISPCVSTGYTTWLRRQYTVGSGSGGGNPQPVANVGSNLAVLELDGSGSSDS